MIELLIAELRDLYEALGLFLVIFDERLQASDDVPRAALEALNDKRFRAAPAMLDFGVIYRWLERALRRHQSETVRDVRLTDIRRMMHCDGQDAAREYWLTLEVLSDTDLLRPRDAYAGIWLPPEHPPVRPPEPIGSRFALYRDQPIYYAGTMLAGLLETRNYTPYTPEEVQRRFGGGEYRVVTIPRDPQARHTEVRRIVCAGPPLVPPEQDDGLDGYYGPGGDPAADED